MTFFCQLLTASFFFGMLLALYTHNIAKKGRFAGINIYITVSI